MTLDYQFQENNLAIKYIPEHGKMGKAKGSDRINVLLQ